VRNLSELPDEWTAPASGMIDQLVDQRLRAWGPTA
jgi:hypothetical protein